MAGFLVGGLEGGAAFIGPFAGTGPFPTGVDVGLAGGGPLAPFAVGGGGFPRPAPVGAP